MPRLTRRPNVAGEGLRERLRSTYLRPFGVVTAVGLVNGRLVANQGWPGLRRQPDSADPQSRVSTTARSSPGRGSATRTVRPWRLSGASTRAGHRRIRSVRLADPRHITQFAVGSPESPEPGRRATRWARTASERGGQGRRRSARRPLPAPEQPASRGPAARVGPGSRLDPAARRTRRPQKVVPRQRQSQRPRKDTAFQPGEKARPQSRKSTPTAPPPAAPATDPAPPAAPEAAAQPKSEPPGKARGHYK